ncbi:MAG: glutamine--fructose-6-phosphate transaminase (isomerizing) [Candidatus Omnitrophica bacterium CG08_land_8_20_14_0_20_41_16]|uniref:Glutamine--fructose-6-phosphate aminotransferase [isomerizing] n=1 Tax=Candidatus Sherwoodlollariibacterium unditelluris TaxID=1974757 RepID=A0A2G9YJ34_9BACT|nr:MAG: glutamine--fructose-6-phosphate transaminase (isomerizing) [Candidatus Omnitrophica bacterium CG23_combo_of_CG06-09_8_20_14_all_41_10]PIS33447.1 MAG: glutamine--fructose-6-phosphate transaminase (isomerizing) [Candidatus Omnitrophica bacterium CG08_land_8_20_14_0_20_41_16]
MCGIIGYIGSKEAQPILLAGLKRLEYRGYDSAGICTLSEDKQRLCIRKLPGKVKDLERVLKSKPLPGSLGIGHCLTADTLVLLADGRILPISKIEDGQKVFVFNFSSSRLEPAKVRVAKHKSPTYLYNIRTSFSSLKCTAQHKLFVISGGEILEKKAGDITRNDMLILPKDIPIQGDKIKFKPIFVKRYFRATQEAACLIKNRLKELQLTKVACASLANISQSYVDHVFRNDRNFREDELQKLLPALSIAFDQGYFIPQNTIHGKFISLPEESSPELMQIIGYLLGDGTVKERCIRFKDLDRELLEVYLGLIEKVFNIQSRIASMNDTRAWLLEVNSFYLCQWLKENIISRKDEFLSELGQLPEDEMAAFLRGIFDAEGCVNIKSGQLSLRITDKRLAKISQLLLLKCGIVTSFYTENKHVKNWNDCYGVFLNNLYSFEQFISIVGLASKIKLKQLNILISKRKITIKNKPKSPGIFNLVPQSILGIEKIKPQDELLFDLEVEHPDANFIANGLLSHNSRWSTHGMPNQVNAHPHLDCKGEIALVHNGIIENYASLKANLIKEGHRFLSQTDTEVIVHLIEKFYKDIPLEEAVRKTLKLLVGSFAVGVISKKEPQKLVGGRSGSPLIVGLGKNENFLASDIPAVLEYTKDIIFLEENEVVVLTKDSYKITDLNGKEISRGPTRINWDISQAQKQGYKHFMLKEINEQSRICGNLLNIRIQKGTHKIIFEELEIPEEKFKSIKNISIVACGTAYHAGMVGKYIIESICGLSVSIDVSSEFRYRDLLLGVDTLVIAISQSGETADTLAGVREARKRGASVISICNVLGSTLTRESDGVIYTYAGPEIGVASTKAYTAQLAALYLFVFYLAKIRAVLPALKVNKYLDELRKIPGQMEAILKEQGSIARLSRKYSHLGSFLYLGRNINYPSALEGALKLKEISYIPAEGYAAGEMKHGPIALIDEYRAVVCIAVESKIYGKMISNIQEIKSRRGKIIAIATEGDAKIEELTSEVIYIPKCDELFSPLLVALPLQLLAYHISVKRGCDVDQPRNLAKSVTVE